MKKIFLSFLSVIIAASALHADIKTAPEDVKKLLDQRKYSSAFVLLNEKDSACANPDIQLVKLEIAMTFFVRTDSHLAFGLVDLKDAQTVESLRGEAVSCDMYTFNIPAVFGGLIVNFPEDYRLHRALGLYYFEISHRFRGRWTVPDEEIIKLYTDNLKQAADHGFSDSSTLYAQGEGCILRGDFDQAIVHLAKSRDMKPDFAPAWYALAWSYMNMNRPKEGIPCAEKAISLYPSPQEKAGATLVLGALKEENNDSEGAFIAYRDADLLNPGNYDILKNLVRVSLFMKKDSDADRSSSSFLLMAPENPLLYQDLVNIYSANNSLETLITFFEKRKSLYAGKKVILGNLYFYTGTIHYLQGRFDRCRADMVRSRESFSSEFPSEHQVFKVIDATISDLDSMNRPEAEKTDDKAENKTENKTETK